MSVCQPSPEKKRKIELEEEVKSISSDMESESGTQQELPKLNELLAPDEMPPFAFSTTIPQVTTLQSGELTTTIPVNSQIVVPVLPECVPLIAQVPDVVTETTTETTQRKSTDTIVTEEVKISQVLPGYAPSYASDYVPSEINTESYNSFVNTLSFNVSRYPTLTEITDSKNYSAKKSSADQTPKLKEEAKKTFDYVPAEYLTGQDTSVSAKTYNSMCALVKPEVLSSGRVLTTMCVPVYQGDENIMKRNESTETDLEGSNAITKEDLETSKDGDDKKGDDTQENHEKDKTGVTGDNKTTADTNDEEAKENAPEKS
jgi:hypothetical protein